LTLKCLSRQTVQADEIIIVNDGCTDATPEVLEAAAAAGMPVREVNRDGVGRAAARNAGADQANEEVIIFVDDDILVPPGFIAAHVRAHVEGAVPVGEPAPRQPALIHGPLHELPGAARLVEADPPDPYQAAVEGGFGRTVVNALERLARQMAEGVAPPVAPWLLSVGANISVRRETWKQIGGFEEEFGVIWGCEDLEFGYRLVAAGACAQFAADATGIHLSHARPDRWAQHASNMSRFTAQHPDPAVCALPELLSAGASPHRYLDALRHKGE
jgi:glycosyltransferase involved in cell wall biosynthesis